MRLIRRDSALETDVLERVARVAQEPDFPSAIQARLDEVEASGGPDGGVITRAIDGLREAYDEYVDGPAWTIVALNCLVDELEHGQIHAGRAVEARLLVEEAMAHAAHAARLMQGAADLLDPATSVHQN